MSWFDWWAQLLGTLIGTGVGFGLATWWDRSKERARVSGERADTVRSILLELQGISDRLATPAVSLTPNPDNSGAVTVEMAVPFLSRSAFDAAVHSGKLTLLGPELQEELSTIYEQLRIMRVHVDNLATSYAHGSTVEEHTAMMENAVQYLRGHADMLTDQLLVAFEHLKADAGARGAT
jgi:hypothetical protein